MFGSLDCVVPCGCSNLVWRALVCKAGVFDMALCRYLDERVE